MAIANYTKTCGKNTPGNRKQFFIAPSGAITVLTEASELITVLTAPSGTFKKVRADIDTVQVTSDGTFTTSGGMQQNLIAKFSMPSTELNVWLDSVIAQINCGIDIIHIDANGKVWLSGITSFAKEGKTRPWNSFQEQLDSGLLMTDEGMQAVTCTFGRLSAYDFTELNPALSDAVKAGTSTFIDWS